MYQPPKYKNDSPEFIFGFIQKHPFATLVLKGDHFLATHVPVLIDGPMENYRLYAHIANHNPMREFLIDKSEMLVVFKGPDAYISSSWYSIPEIPTWDYTAVHINATITVQTDSQLQTSLENLIKYFERDVANPLQPQSIPKQLWNENFKEITGFWLDPIQAVGIEKLHQGFEKKDIKNIAEKLNKERGCPMENLRDAINKKHGL